MVASQFVKVNGRYYNGSIGVTLPQDSVSANNSEQLGHATWVDALQAQRITWEIILHA